MARESAAPLALCALVLWAPLPAGSVTPAAEMAFRLAAFAVLALAAAIGRSRLWRARWKPLAALAGLALLGLGQSCRWPAAVTAAVSPEHARLYRQAAAIDPEAAAPSSIPMSLEPALSRSSALSWLAAAALLAAAVVAGRRARHRRWLLWALVAAALVQLIIGLWSLWRSHPAGLGLLLRPSGRIRGTFANSNHLSLLFEMTMAPVAAWGWYALQRSRRAAPRRAAAAVAPLLLWSVLLLCVAFTGSRAGMAAALFGFGVQVVAMSLAGRRRRFWVPVVAVLVALGALTALAARFEIQRYESVGLFEDNLRSRLRAQPAALELWRRFPLSGTGLGTFEEAFPMVAPPELSRVTWNRAHNDPIELLVTGGLAGLALGSVAAIALLVPLVRGIRRGRRAEDRAAGLAALGAFGAAGFHELLDFGLVIPANHLTLLVILGAALSVRLSRPAGEARDGGQGDTAASR